MIGGHDIKQSGKTSGVTADDFAQARDIGAVAPGKINLAQSRDVGNQWIDRGAACDGKGDSVTGCFMSDQQRQNLIIDFKDLVLGARENYKSALDELRVDLLVQKDDDLNWILSLVLDTASAHFVSIASKALQKVKAKGVKAIEERLMDAAARSGIGDDQKQLIAAEKMLHRVSDKSIETYTKQGFDLGKKEASKALQGVLNEDDKDNKVASLSYIEQLKNDCDIGFRQFEQHAIGAANDAELVVLWEGMQPAYHYTGIYKTALKAKIERMKAADIPRIGINEIGKEGREAKEPRTYHSMRVVRLRDFAGGTSLWYESYRGHAMLPFDDNLGDLDRRVPDEFADAAVARSEQQWGPIKTFDDPSVTLMRGYSGPSVFKPPAQVPRVELKPTVANNDPSGAGTP